MFVASRSQQQHSAAANDDIELHTSSIGHGASNLIVVAETSRRAPSSHRARETPRAAAPPCAISITARLLADDDHRVYGPPLIL